MRVRGRRRMVILPADVQVPVRGGLVTVAMRVAVDLARGNAPETDAAEHR